MFSALAINRRKHLIQLLHRYLHKHPEPTATPEPTPTPEPDPDENVDAILYRFGYEGEDIIDSMFDGVDLTPMNAILEYTDDGLLITVQGAADPYFSIPLPEGSIDVEKYPILRIDFKHSSKLTQGQFYIGFDGEAIVGSDQNYFFTVSDAEDWQTAYLNFAELKPGAQTITSFRADIISGAPIDSTIVLDFLGFFPTKEAAEAYIPPNHRVPTTEK